jgi:hypothetical protein
MVNVGIFYGHLKYSTVIWHILWPFVDVVVIWSIFPRFGVKKNLATLVRCHVALRNPSEIFETSHCLKSQSLKVRVRTRMYVHTLAEFSPFSDATEAET